MPEPVNSALDDARKRARRRLVGAIVLALIAAVVVPLFLESDPKPLGPDVQIQIPAIDDAKFQNRLTPPSKAGAPEPSVAVEAGKGRSAQLAPSGSDTPRGAKGLGAPPDGSAPAPPVVAPPRSEPQTPAAAPTVEAAPRATSEAMSVDKSESKGTARSDGKAAEKQPATSADKADKQPAKAGDKAEKQAEKAADKAEKPSDKAAQAAKAAPQSAPVKALEPATNLGTATLNTVAPAPAKGGEFVVQLGAFVDKAVATELAAKAGEQGYAVFLEPVTTKSGPVQRVRVGPFPTRAAADAAAAKLAASGFTAVTRPR